MTTRRALWETRVVFLHRSFQFDTMSFRMLVRQSRALVGTCALVFVVMLVTTLAWPKTAAVEKVIVRKKAEHKVVPLELYVPVWLKKGFVINTGLAGLMLLASPWLGRRLSRSYEAPRASIFEGWTWKTWAIAAGASAFGLWNTAPRNGH